MVLGMSTSHAPQPPIACSLPPAGYRSRIADMRDLADRALLDRADVRAGQRLTFAAGHGVEDRLREIVAAEASCCAFLTFDVTRGADALTLTVTGPEDALPIIHELFA